jgi:hypothetical protein
MTRDGRLPSVKIGNRRVVPVPALLALLAPATGNSTDGAA